MKLHATLSRSLAAAALFGAVSVSAHAAAINFDQEQANNPSGVISYDGNGGGLAGQNISFSYINLVNDGAPAGHDDKLVCQSRCFLNFTTGANTMEGSKDNSNLYTFGSGGSFELTGTVMDSSGTIVASDALLSGVFTGSSVASKNGQTSSQFIGSGDNSVNADLLTYFGINSAAQFIFATSEMSLGNTKYRSNGGFTGNVTAADLNTTSVPEPQELAMFGLGLCLLVGGLAFRRQDGAGDLIG